MKKLFVLILSATVALTALTGCKTAETEDKPQGPLRICVDVLDASFGSPDSAQISVENVVSTLEMYHEIEGWGAEKYEVEVIPSSGVERETALTRVRTAIMSGEGPDVFIVTSPDPSSTLEALFPYPEKAMLSGYFLPLDKYMKNSQFTDWDKLEPTIMEAGKTEEGQMILPMTFDLMLTYFHQDEVEGYDGSTRWQDMVEGNDPILSAAASPVTKGSRSSVCNWFPSVFNEYVDYGQERLLFTEEELLETVRGVSKLPVNGKAPDHYSDTPSRVTFSIGVSAVMMDSMNGIGFHDDMTMVPIYNQEGGTTAMVSTFFAVNRNTTQPQNAFTVADYFLSESMQVGSSLYGAWMSVNMISNTEYIKSKMTENQAEEFARVLDQISCVRYWTPLDMELANIIDTASSKGWTEEKLRENVSTTYEKMKMMIAES